jgi:hypothetical protein
VTAGGPAGFGNCYGYEVNANANLPGRPAVVDQPFGSGHAIMLGFDAWYRAWTTQDERLVLNGVFYPTGSAIPAAAAFREFGLARLHAETPAAPVPAGSLPSVASRPVYASGAFGGNEAVVIKVKLSRAAALRSAVKAAKLPGRIRTHIHYVKTRTSYVLVIRGARTGDAGERTGWESPLMGAIARRKIQLQLGQL